MKTELLGVKAPSANCTDKKCPFHGGINVKKEFFTGRIIKKDVNRSAIMEWFMPFFVPKYERYEIRRVRMHVHNPLCIDAGVGDMVLVARTRPLSKTKNHVVIQNLHSSEQRKKQISLQIPKGKKQSSPSLKP